MNQLIKDKKYLFSKFNYFFITILPITLLAGSLISNLAIILIGLFFIFDLIDRKNNFILKDKNFYFLILIYFYLILNSLFISSNPEAFYKSLAFIRFILLAYALNFYFEIFNRSFLKIWALIFIIVTLDIFIEFSFGKNIFGYESNYYGRIASFTGEELKIGGFYFGFLFICLAFFKDKMKLFILTFVVFFLTALIIGERSNFLKISIMYILYLFFFANISNIKKLLIILLLSITSILVITNVSLLKSKYKSIFNRFDRVDLSETGNYYKGLIENNRHFIHYYIATQIFKENIFFGKGFKSYRVESYKENYFKDRLDFSVGYGSTHPHQLHFEILSELGIIGYILILSNLIFILSKTKNIKKDFLMKSSILFIIASLIPILPSGSFFTSYGATIFFINYSFLIKRDNETNLK